MDDMLQTQPMDDAPQTQPMDDAPQGFPVREPRRSYNLSYEGDCVDAAVRGDRADWLQHCIARGWIDSASCTLGSWTIRRLCVERGARACAALLEELGWPLRFDEIGRNAPALRQAPAALPIAEHAGEQVEEEAS